MEFITELSKFEFGTVYTLHTVWKIQDFSVTKILHEINLGECRSFETVVFANLGALKC